MLSGTDDEDVADRDGSGTKPDVCCCSCWCCARANDADDDNERKVILAGSLFDPGDLSADNLINGLFVCTTAPR